jgi:hypothetical protein
MSGTNSPLKRNSINRESGVHGTQWQMFHGGYFSDPAVANPFIEIAHEAVALSRPQIIVDLGGGTGFILQELIKHSIDPGIRLVNLDLSRKQLGVTCDDRIIRLRRSLTGFRRADASKEADQFLFIMRSALHYFGRDGLMPFLHHLRSQMKKSEFFVHQTACFDRITDARCLNRLYECMGTNKWYPTKKYLCGCLEKAGWSITSVASAPMLALTSDDLRKRYRLHKRRLAEIRDEVSGCCDGKKNVFSPSPDGFCAYLHYRIFTCIAK